MGTAVENTEEVLRSFDETMREFLNCLTCFSNDNINIVPFEGSWTGGQLAEHMILSNEGLAKLLDGPFKETERPPDEKLPMLRDLFLDFSTKLNAPDNTVPPLKSYTKEDVVNSFEQIRESANKNLQGANLAQTCDVDLPFFGYLTVWEVTCFMTYHTQRHIRQLKKIWQAVESK